MTRDINELIYASEADLWSVLTAATNAMGPHTASEFGTRVHAAGASIITERRKRLALSCEALQVSTEPTMQVSCAWLAQLRTEFLEVHKQREALQAQVPTWQPMSTAPVDRRIMLKRPRWFGGTIGAVMDIGVGRYETQQHHRTPRPYWNDDRKYISVAENRKSEPVGWMEIPR